MVQTERDGLSHQHTLRFPLCIGLHFAAYWSRKVGSWKAGIPVELGLALVLWKCEAWLSWSWAKARPAPGARSLVWNIMDFGTINSEHGCWVPRLEWAWRGSPILFLPYLDLSKVDPNALK